MLTATTVAEVRARVRQWRAEGLRVSLVPTMGNLHAGHISLLAAARLRTERVITSIFVNPLQFGPNEDYAQYPRTPVEDQRLLDEARCDVLFAPGVEQIYPEGADQLTRVHVRGLSEILDGEFRPGHFDGVATVVAKLFHIVAPDVAVFGEKDYQQLMIVRRMTADLAMPIDIVGAPTVRASDGLAISSRNRYLDAEQRTRVPAIHQALRTAVRALDSGAQDLDALERAGATALAQAGMQVDYFSIRSALDLSQPDARNTDLVVLAAARIGRSRLIDNMRAYRTLPAARRGG
jgi:pantoate--beta-alanine ligase